MLDECDHGRSTTAFGMPQPGPRRADRRRDRQFTEPTRCPIALYDHAGSDRQGFVPPEIERFGDALPPLAFIGGTAPLYLRRVRADDRLVIIRKQPEPAQLGEHVITRTTGVAMHD